MDHMREIIKLKPDGKFELNLKYFRHHNEKLNTNGTAVPQGLEFYFPNELEKLLGSARLKDNEINQYHKNIAHSVQAMYEGSFFHLQINYIPSIRLKELLLQEAVALILSQTGK